MAEPNTCRWERCEIAAAENGYFCRNDWRVLSLETKHLLLAFPPGGEWDESARNSALHKALSELRRELHVPAPVDLLDPIVVPQPSEKLDQELRRIGVDPVASREGRRPAPPKPARRAPNARKRPAKRAAKAARRPVEPDERAG